MQILWEFSQFQKRKNEKKKTFFLLLRDFTHVPLKSLENVYVKEYFLLFPARFLEMKRKIHFSICILMWKIVVENRNSPFHYLHSIDLPSHLGLAKFSKRKKNFPVDCQAICSIEYVCEVCGSQKCSFLFYVLFTR